MKMKREERKEKRGKESALKASAFEVDILSHAQRYALETEEMGKG